MNPWVLSKMFTNRDFSLLKVSSNRSKIALNDRIANRALFYKSNIDHQHSESILPDGKTSFSISYLGSLNCYAIDFATFLISFYSSPCFCENINDRSCHIKREIVYLNFSWHKDIEFSKVLELLYWYS